MAQGIDLKARGLYTHPNPLGSIPAGGMLIADNIVIDREDTSETRRGFKKYGSAFSGAINKFFEYQDRLIVHYSNKLSYDSDGAGTFTDYSGTYTAPLISTKIRSVLSNKNFYFTTSAGIKKLDSLTGTVQSSGVQSGLDGEGATTGASGWFDTSKQVAYRVVFGITDANNNKILGAPSQRIIVSNTSGGTRNVNVTFTVPSTLSTSHFYQVYRSVQSPDLNTEPTDELQLVVEKNLVAGDISTGYTTYTDETPDNLRGATLYTSPSQEGITQSNNQPPLAADVTLFNSNVLYANTIGKQRMYMTLISIGGTNGLVNDDTIVIAGTTYTGKATETIASGQFKIATGGTPSQNIDETAKSLIRVINRYATNTLVYATYLTGYSDLPGQILIEERGIAASAFVATSSRGGAFSPSLPSSGTTYSSAADIEPNAIYISKSQQPEAVPLTNKVYAGAAQKKILRVIALRDSTFVIKEDGVFRITGTGPSDYAVTLFDGTATVIGEESVVSFNNAVYCYADQGISAISDSGVAIISRPIEFDILKLSSEQYTNFKAASFGISYESDRKYMFATITNTSDTYATQIFVYNTATQTFTRWPLNVKCGMILTSTNKLYLGNAVNNTVYIERKNFDATDYAMEELSVTITSASGTTVNLSSTTGVAAGDTLAQFSGTSIIRESVVASVDSGTALTVRDSLSWTAGAAISYKPIQTTIKYVPIHGGNPGMVKLFNDLVLFFSNANFDSLNLEFTSDQDIGPEDFDVTPNLSGLWGLFPWGSIPWGSTSGPLQPIRTVVPAAKARAHWYNLTITHSQALSNFSLVGITSFYEEISEIMK